MKKNLKPDGYITFNGKKYPYKESENGYRFSIESFSEVLMTPDQDDFVSDDAEVIDSTIAYFFEDEEFAKMTAEELYREFDLHS